MEVEIERGREWETEKEKEKERRKRVRSRGAVSRKDGPAISPAEFERLACLTAEVKAALERRAAEAKTAPKVDRYALQASRFRDTWNSLWSGYFGSFDDTTRIKPMRFTDEPAPPSTASTCSTLQIFSVKVAGITEGLQWPLQVFGMVALRDSIDHNRNIIFQRTRDNCQILTEKDPYLELTGPSRAVVSLGPVTFEVGLTVKGSTESEDKDLSALAVPFLSCTPDSSCLLNMCYPSKLSTLELTLGYLICSVEASVSVQVIKGAWPDGFHVQFAATTACIGQEKAILHYSGGGTVPVTGDGMIKLSRHVASVEMNTKLKVSVKAWQGDDNKVERGKDFTPKKASRSHGILDVGFCKMKVTVAWSLVSLEPPSYESSP